MEIIENGNIFDSKCQTIVNTINCVGVMGKGLAKEYARRYPEMLDKYKELCSNKLIRPGILWLWRASDKLVLNFPTKDDWRYDSRYEWIEMGLKKFVSTYKEKGITSIAFPMLGCNNGHLNKDKVLILMRHYLENLEDIKIEIYK